MINIVSSISRITIITIYLVIINIPQLISAEENKKYIGKGESIIVNNDIPSAKKKALLDAFKDAIQKAVGVYVKAQSKVENFEMTYNKIMGESEGYITNYKIIKEKKDDNIYHVEIEAEVSSEKLGDAFSQRISKYIEKNLVSNFQICIQIMDSNYIRKQGYSPIRTLYFMATVNDPTIDKESITIKLPKTGWIKPPIINWGNMILIKIEDNYQGGAKGSTSKYIADVISLLNNQETEIKLKNPSNNKMETRKISFSEISCSIIKNNAELVKIYSDNGFKKFGDVNKKELKNASNILREYLQ